MIQYFDPDSVYELNVPSTVRDELEEEMKLQKASSDIFNKAQESVYKTMHLDSWPRFQQHPSYRTYQAGSVWRSFDVLRKETKCKENKRYKVI